MSCEDDTLRDRGRRLRAGLTDEERKLWAHLRAQRLGGFKFRRQHPIGPYCADFCCVARHLIIELDGSQHAEPEQERKDGLRWKKPRRRFDAKSILSGVLCGWVDGRLRASVAFFAG